MKIFILKHTFFYLCCNERFSERKGLERFSESKGLEASAQYTEGVKELRIMGGKRPIEKDWVMSLTYPLSDRTQRRIGKGKRVIPPPFLLPRHVTLLPSFVSIFLFIFFLSRCFLRFSLLSSYPFLRHAGGPLLLYYPLIYRFRVCL